MKNQQNNFPGPCGSVYMTGEMVILVSHERLGDLVVALLLTRQGGYHSLLRWAESLTTATVSLACLSEVSPGILYAEHIQTWGSFDISVYAASSVYSIYDIDSDSPTLAFSL